MPLDSTGYLPQRVLTEDEERDLAVLKAARHLIRHRWRWWGSRMYGEFVPGLRRHCALTAVDAAVKATVGLDYRMVARAQQRLTDNLLPGWSSVMTLNDHSTTTHADVLALFDRAIAELE